MFLYAGRYIHDDSETVKDSLGLTVTDGTSSTQADLLVQVRASQAPLSLGYFKGRNGTSKDLLCFAESKCSYKLDKVFFFSLLGDACE